MDTSSLVKTLLKTEEECRCLRNELRELERARRVSRCGEMAITAPVSQSAVVTKDRNRTTSLPVDAVDEITRKAGEVSLVLKEHEGLLKERDNLQKILADSEIQTEEATHENDELKQRLGHTGNETIFHMQDTIEAVERANQLKFEILQALKDRYSIQETLKRQTQNLRSLANELRATKDLEEKRDLAASQLKEKRNELENIRQEIYSMRRMLEQKDTQLEKEKPVDQLTIARNAESERRVVLYRLEREQESVRMNDMSIRHRALQIAKLEKRIEMIGDAISGKDTFDGERVEAGEVEKTRREISMMTRIANENEARLNALDAEIADLDRRSDGLISTAANARKEMQRILKYHRKITNIQQKELREEQEATEEEIKEIEKEIEMLKDLSVNNVKKPGRKVFITVKKAMSDAVAAAVPVKKVSPKKVSPKKTSPKRSTAKKPAAKKVAKKSVVKKPAAKKAARKSAPKKAAKKVDKKSAVKKPAAKKGVKKPAAKKVAKKAPKKAVKKVAKKK